MNLPKLTIADAAGLVEVTSGTPSDHKCTLATIMRNEEAVLPAFLAHYRDLGIEQFLIIDDRSDDATGAILAAAPDVVVLKAALSFGEQVLYTDPAGETRQERAGTYFKIAVPHHFCPDHYVTYFDADEFMFLPPGVSGIPEIIERLKAEGAASAVSSLVEFFPARVHDLAGDMPTSFTDLLARYPYFEPEALVRLVPGAQPDLIGQPKSARLFAAEGIQPDLVRRGWHRLYMPSKVKRAQSFQKSPRHKTPIVLRSAQTYLTGSHKANMPPSSDVLLCAAHFVFTAQFADKIDRALSWGAHANGAAKYRYYQKLLSALAASDTGFLAPSSVTFESVGQLLDAGLMRW